MRITRTLVWLSRAFFALAGLLVVGLVAYGVAGAGSTDQGADDAKMRVFGLVFCSIAWCILLGASVRTLTTATTWPRALLTIAGTVGFGVFFTAIVLLISGTLSVVPAAALGIGGLVVTTVAPVVSFIAFGAKEAVGQIEQAVEQVQHSIADARDHAVAPPPPSAEEGPKASGAGPEFLPH